MQVRGLWALPDGVLGCLLRPSLYHEVSGAFHTLRAESTHRAPGAPFLYR